MRYYGTHGVWCNTRTFPTSCQYCSQSVFYFSCDHGSKVFFDKLGDPWPVHKCLASRGRSTSLESYDPYSSVAVISLEEAYTGTTAQVGFFLIGRNLYASVDIPPGVDNGSKVKATAEWTVAALTVMVGIKPHPMFTRKGSDLHMDITLPADASGGDTIQVQAIDGQPLDIVVPKKIPRRGSYIRLLGYGMPVLDSLYDRGDLIICIKRERKGLLRWLFG